MKAADAYIEGWNAFLNGITLNPYADSLDWDARRHWEWGWECCQAYKQNMVEISQS